MRDARQADADPCRSWPELFYLVKPVKTPFLAHHMVRYIDYDPNTTGKLHFQQQRMSMDLLCFCCITLKLPAQGKHMGKGYGTVSHELAIIEDDPLLRDNLKLLLA